MKDRAPPYRHLIAEPRAIGEYLRWMFLRYRIIRRCRVGDGHPVIVYPGLLAGDALTRPLRLSLDRLGYQVEGWGMGLNVGLRTGLLESLQVRLRHVHHRTGRKVSLIGWSLGGLYARELAKREPDRVRQVITLGTPFCGDMRANHAWRLYELINDHKVDAPPIDSNFADPPPVPTTSIYSRSDGIVSPACSLNPVSERLENIRIYGSHIGLPWNPQAIRIVANRLAQPEDGWKPHAGKDEEEAPR